MLTNPQKEHYERIHDAYERHYFDATSLAYRRRFIFSKLIESDDLNGKRVADIACGSGHNTLLLNELFSNLRSEGFDISSSACAAYAENTGAAARELDITQPLSVPFEPFDAAIVVGGLHHCINDMSQTFANLHTIIRPGGRLYLVEPNANYVLERLRSVWYRHDPYFDSDTERALDLGELEKSATGFAPARHFYFGGPAYFIVFNSLVTRMPLSTKGWIAPPLFACEGAWHSLMPNSWMAAFGAVWDRVD